MFTTWIIIHFYEEVDIKASPKVSWSYVEKNQSHLQSFWQRSKQPKYDPVCHKPEVIKLKLLAKTFW